MKCPGCSADLHLVSTPYGERAVCSDCQVRWTRLKTGSGWEPWFAEKYSPLTENLRLRQGEVVVHLGQIVDASYIALPLGLYARADGSPLPIGDYPELYEIVGDLYGGDDTVFNLPDLRTRVLVDGEEVTQGSNYYIRVKP